MKTSKLYHKQLRAKRTRAKIRGTAIRPRLSIFRSNQYIYAQLIDDVKGTTLASGSTAKIKEGKNKTEKAMLLGKELSAAAKKVSIKKVIFDRGAYKYHGRVKAVADGAREGGLEF